jgi:hypothetical protein
MRTPFLVLAFSAWASARNLDRFAIRRENDEVVVDLNRLYRSDKQPQEWGAALVQL